MFNKKIFFIFCLFLIVVGISAVSAEDVSSSYEVDDVANTVPTFDDAQYLIDHPSDVKHVYLKNQTFVANNTQSLTINSDIKIFGGYFSEHDSRRSTLDANGLTNILNIAGNHKVYLINIDIINSKSTSSAIVLNSNSNLILENVNFINCEVSGSGLVRGGALYIDSKASVTATGGNFINNTAKSGGAVYVNAGGYFFADNVNFINNKAENGAAISGFNNINVQNSYFYNNSADVVGGAIYATYDVKITNSRFYNNSANSKGGAIYATYNVKITNSRFNKNSAGVDGGAIWGSYNIDILNSLFEENTAKFGGAVVVDSSVNIDGSTFKNNSAEFAGAIGVKSSLSSLPLAEGTITNSVFDNNNATKGAGAAIYFSGDLTVMDSIFSSQGCEGGSNIFVPTEGIIKNENNVFASNLLDTNLGSNVVVSVGKVANNKVTITIYVPYGSKGNIKVSLNKGQVTEINNQVNKYSVEIPNLVNGINNISVSFSGDSEFVSAYDLVVVENNHKSDVDLSVSTPDITYKENAVINIECSVNGPVEVRIGNIIKTVDVVNNKATLSVSDLDAGSYPIVVTYAGDNNYNKEVVYSLLNVAKASSSLYIVCSASGSTGFVNIYSNMPGYFIIYLDDEEYGTFYANNGNLRVDIPYLGGGDHNIKVVSNNSNYESAEATGTLSIVENIKLNLNSASVREGEKSTVAVYVETTAGDPVSGITIIFTINGTEIAVKTNNGGTATLNGIYKAGYYPVTARFDKQNVFGYTVAKGYLLVTPSIIAENVVKNNNEQFDYSVKLVDKDGKPSTNKQLTFKIDGKTYYGTTDSEGKTSISLKLTSGNYTMLITAPNGVSIEKNIFILPKNMPSLNINTVTNLNNAVITVTLGESAEGNITFDINGEKYNVAISDNKAVLNLTNLPNNLYRINATLSSPDFAPLSKMESFRINIPRDELIIESNPVEIKFKEVCNIVVKVTDLLNVPLADLLVITSINGVDYINYTNSAGIAKFSISNLNSGYYPVYIYCEGNTTYQSKTIESSVTVTPIDMSRMSLSSEVNYNDVIITATFSEKVPVGRVLFVIGGKKYYEVISNNKAVLKLTLSSKGNYTVNAYLNSINYNNISNSTKFEIKSIRGVLQISVPPVEMFYKDGSRLYITVTDDIGNPLKDISVIIQINGVNYTKITGNDGKVSMSLNLRAAVYPVNVQFKGSSDYDPVNVTSYVIIKSTIVGNDIEKYYRNDTQFYVTILDNAGKPVPNVVARININGVFYDKTTNSEGVARLNINLGPNTYIATVTNPITNQENSFTVTVLSTIIISDLTKYYRNDSQLFVKFLDKQGNPLVGAEISININGVFYYRTTDSDGIARLNINLGPSVYIATAQCQGLVKSCRVTVLPTIVSENLEMTKSNRVPFVVKLLDNEGNPAPIGSKSSFNINGVLYERVVNNVNGTVKLNINLMSGTYIITTSYNRLSISNTIKILPY